MAMIEELLQREHSRLRALVEHEAGRSLRYESVDDLVQGIAMRALRSDFEYVDDARAIAWLKLVARRFLKDRHAYWSAMRRASGQALRLTMSDVPASGVGISAVSAAGPATFAERRELVELAMRALGTLPDRDRELVQWASQGVELDEQAERLGVSYAACQRAGVRARERFRLAFDVLVRSTS